MTKKKLPRYLGEYPVDVKDTPFAAYTATDWALYWIGSYGGIDGEHHKTWVIDQVVRILNGAPVVIVQARWDDGTTEYRHDLGPSARYRAWVVEQKAGEDGPDTYSWDVGIAP